jgi:beta-1,4-mannosyl-glycoprotein beta-1,4-N-acetylglucosaminyltransferase
VAPRSPCCPSPELPFQAATPHLRPGCWDALDRRWQSASGVVVPYRVLAAGNAFALRFGEIDATLADGGRHFSSVDPSTHLDRKLHRVFHTEWAGGRETSPLHLARCRTHGVHHRGWWYAERPDGSAPDDIQRLVDRLGSPTVAFPSLRRRRLVRTWAWLRLDRRIPDRAVAAVDRRFDRLMPLLAPPLFALDLVRQAAGSTSRTPRADISPTNSLTSRSHVARSTS